VNGLDICAGGGIGSAVWKEFGGRTVCYVERDPYCQRLLMERMADSAIPTAPLWDDLRTFDGEEWCGCVDFLFAGLPCQPYSVAGKQLGAADPRDLWPDFVRVLREVRPAIALLENSPRVVTHPDGLDRWGRDLAESGYVAEWDCISAAAIGAWHGRNRLWLVAYAEGQSLGAGLCESEQAGQRGRRLGDGDSAGNWWAAEPDVGRVADGVARRVDRLRVLGNGWVPQVAAVVMARCAELLGATLMEAAE